MNATNTPTTPLPRGSRWLPLARAGWVIFTVLAVGLVLAGLPWRYVGLLEGYQRSLSGMDVPASAVAVYSVLLIVAVVAMHVALAALVFRRAPRDPVALLVALTLSANGALLPLAFVYGDMALPQVWRGLIDAVASVGLVSSICTLYLFPNGRFVPRWTLPLAVVWAVASPLAVFAPAEIFDFARWPLLLQAALLMIWVATGLYAQVYRYTAVSDPVQQQQAKWAAAGLLAAAMTPLVYFLSFAVLPTLDLESLPNQLVNRFGSALFTVPALGGLIGMTLLALGMMVFPATLVIAVLRYRLWDIDLVINRTLVYGALTATVVAIYALIVSGLGLALQTQTSGAMAIAATVVAALLALPLRQRLQRGVNRLMYGQRDEPLVVLSRLAMTLEAAGAPADVLPNLARSVAESLRLPYVAIELVDGEQAFVAAEHRRSLFAPAATGDAPHAAHAAGEEDASFPLGYQGQRIGRLIVAPRAPGEALSPADIHLLADLARQAGPAVHAVRLTADLQRSRQRLVTAREEERRRLRRDLHDGLGPQLASLGLRVDAARNLIVSEPDEADRLLADFKAQTQAAIGDIRRLVHGLRPPALDQLGLAGALREQSNALDAANGMHVVLEAPPDLPTLPAAVEVAAYRIVQEALTNATRHSQARRCVVWLCPDDALYIAVDDDGIGVPAPRDAQPGVGMASMRERAEELGGALRIERRPEGGTRVIARLPVTEA